jgi:hypothetical protein
VVNNRIEEILYHAILISTASNIEIRGNRVKNYYKSGPGDSNGVYAEYLSTGRIVSNEFKPANTESYAVYVDPRCSQVRIANNILNYSPTLVPPLRNDGSSPTSDVFYGDVLLTTPATGVILTDRATGARYRIKVENGVLGVESATNAKNLRPASSR